MAKAMMRIWTRGPWFDLQGLGMDAETYRLYSQLIRLPTASVVTGPTGSGKTAPCTVRC